jgi:hypothetical protein
MPAIAISASSALHFEYADRIVILLLPFAIHGISLRYVSIEIVIGTAVFATGVPLESISCVAVQEFRRAIWGVAWAQKNRRGP